MSRSPRELWFDARQRLEKDGPLSARLIAHHAARYARARASAAVHLRSCTTVGARARTEGRPRIDNLGTIVLGDDVQLRSVVVPVELATGPGGILQIGHQVNINYGTSIGCLDSIIIGNRVRIGTFVLIVDSDFHGIHQRNLRPRPEPVRVDDDVWLGAKSSVLKGVTVGRGSIVGTGAVVTKDVPPFSIVAGVPARKVGEVDPERFVPEGDVHAAPRS